MRLTTQKQVREAFWQEYPTSGNVTPQKTSHGDYNTDTRCAFVEFVDYLQREGHISESLAQRVTL